MSSEKKILITSDTQTTDKSNFDQCDLQIFALNENDLHLLIEQQNSRGFSALDALNELVWRDGEREVSLYFEDDLSVKQSLPTIIRNELETHFNKKNNTIYKLCKRNKNQLFTKEQMALIAAEGNLRLLKWGREHGCEWDGWTCACAAANGHLQVLQYAHENGCPWDEDTCDEAAVNGYSECLKYAYENSCPWDYLTCECAVRAGNWEFLRYAHENGYPCKIIEWAEYDDE